jgi:hypothetical protein
LFTQKSSVHALLSEQFFGTFTQPTPATQTSVVQTLPSSHVAVVCVQLPVIHLSVVHGLPSEHTMSEAHATGRVVLVVVFVLFAVVLCGGCADAETKDTVNPQDTKKSANAIDVDPTTRLMADNGELRWRIFL